MPSRDISEQITPLITLGKPATDTEQIEQLVDAAEGRAPKVQKKRGLTLVAPAPKKLTLPDFPTEECAGIRD